MTFCSLSPSQVLQIVSSIGAVAVTLILLHIILTFIAKRCRDRKANYRTALPSVPAFYHQSSTTTEEEEVLLLQNMSSQRNKESAENEWEEDDSGREQEHIDLEEEDRLSSTDHHSNVEL